MDDITEKLKAIVAQAGLEFGVPADIAWNISVEISCMQDESGHHIRCPRRYQPMRERAIVLMREAGYSVADIVKAMHFSAARPVYIALEKIPQLVRKSELSQLSEQEIAGLKSRIIELRARGFPRKNMPEELKVQKQTVDALIIQIRKEGKLSKAVVRRVSGNKEDRIFWMRRSGKTIAEICSSIKTSAATIRKIMKKRGEYVPYNTEFAKGFCSPRMRAIIRKTAAGKTQVQIGLELGVSHSAVSYLIGKFIAVNGKEYFDKLVEDERSRSC